MRAPLLVTAGALAALVLYSLLGAARAETTSSACRQWEVQTLNSPDLMPKRLQPQVIPEGWEPIGGGGNSLGSYVLRRCTR
jgi:hypothetical protein